MADEKAKLQSSMKKPVDIQKASADIDLDVKTKAMLARPLPEWRPVLAQECQVYVLGENYIGKRFDQINYRYCEKYEAEEIVTNNIYALLRTKYFPKASELTDDRIKEIVNSFTANLMTTLLKVSLQNDPDCTSVSFLPRNCIAFRNGVYDFEKADWLFKYNVIPMPQIGNKMYLYAPEYLIMWYLDFDFDPLPISIMSTPIDDMMKMFKDLCKTKKTQNMCFELMYNIAHDSMDKFDKDRFMHLCEILGYVLLQDFSQNFVLLIGAGQNGKNSLFDGCFTNYVVPTPASNSLEDIERDRFITGSLENKAHNIFLETSPEIHTESKMLKNLTGSLYQTIESKGVSKYSGIINCKYIFSGNDQEKIKFSDTTTGFRRRINIFEIFYTWDSQKRFLKHGDYYDTTFSDDLRELKSDISNVTAFCYFGMYGIMNATDKFSANFKFTFNDWKLKYSDADMEVKDELMTVTRQSIVKWLSARSKKDPDALVLFYDMKNIRLYNSTSMSDLGYKTYDDMLKMLTDDDAATSYFTDNDVFVSLKSLQKVMGDMRSAAAFSTALKKIYKLNSSNFKPIYNNTMYVRCKFLNDKLSIVES